MSDELTDAQVEHLRTALVELASELDIGLLANADSTNVVDLDQPIGRLSRMDAIQQQRIAQANKARTVVRLGRVRAALSNVHNDDYGLCKNCEEDIGFPRLKAKPETPFCLACQREFEAARSGHGRR